MKPHKIFYVPGLISAILIPLLFCYYGNRKLNEPIQNTISIGLPARYETKTPLNKQLLTFERLRNWDYKKIIVKPNEARKNSRYYVSELKKLQKRNQKNTGVEFIIGNNNSYDDFISILNDLEIAQQDTYALDIDKTGHLFATVNYKDPNKIEEPCYLCNDVIVEYYDPSFYEDSKYYLSHLPKQAFYLIFGYLFLLQVSVLSLIRKSI